VVAREREVPPPRSCTRATRRMRPLPGRTDPIWNLGQSVVSIIMEYLEYDDHR
jgi:hypothetical protein